MASNETMSKMETSLSSHVEESLPIGTHRLWDANSKKVILTPRPSQDPNDPLNWSAARRYYVYTILCIGTLMVTFIGGAPAIAVPQMTIAFFGPPGRNSSAYIAKTAYFITTTPLTQGIGQLFWMPLILQYGRRPVAVLSCLLFTLTVVWSGVATSYASELASRILTGLAAGAFECLTPVVATDLFFLHERGSMVAFFTACVSSGATLGILISGFVVDSYTWRYIYYITIAILGALTVLYALTLPETAFKRSSALTLRDQEERGDTSLAPAVSTQNAQGGEQEADPEDMSNLRLSGRKISYGRSLRLYSGSYTRESLFAMLVRPIVLLLLPPVLWASLVEAVSIGFFVAVTSNVAVAFGETYRFDPGQIGLCFLAPLIASILAIFFGGTMSDQVANFFTGRNGGVRVPEMRIPAIVLGAVLTPAGLVLYGLSIEHGLHWSAPTIALGILMFAMVQSNNVVIVYTIDSYRPISGEVLVSQFAFKSCFGFLLSFYTNPWIDRYGYATAFGTMAGIAGAVMICGLPLHFWGQHVRTRMMHWSFMKPIRWTEDREVGE